MREDVPRDRPATPAPARAVDAEVAHEGDHPRPDRAPLGDILGRALADGHEGVVDDVLGLGTVAHDPQREREQHPRVPVVERCHGRGVPAGDPTEELGVGRVIHSGAHARARVPPLRKLVVPLLR